jgi:hypothetical protein
LLFDLIKLLEKNISDAKINYCIPKLMGFDDLKTLEIADGLRIFVNPYEYHSKLIKKVIENEVPNKTLNNSKWISDALIFNLNIAEDLYYNHKGYWRSDKDTNSDYTNGGTFLKAIAILPTVKEMGYNTLYIEDNLDDLSQLQDSLIEEISPGDQFKAFIEIVRCMNLNIITEVDLSGISENPRWDYLEKKFLVFSEIYSLDAVVLKLNEDANLSELSPIIGRVKQFDNGFTFIFSSSKHVDTSVLKQLGFQAYLSGISAVLMENKNYSFFREEVVNRKIPTIINFKTTDEIDSIAFECKKRAVFSSFFCPNCLASIGTFFNFGCSSKNWKDADSSFYYHIKKVCELKNKYNLFLSKDKVFDMPLTNSERILSYVYKQKYDDAALIVLINTDNLSDHWVTIDLSSLKLKSFNRVKRKLNGYYEEFNQFLEIENNMVYVHLDACESTLLTVR